MLNDAGEAVEMSYYSKFIVDATGREDSAELFLIEECVRQDIVHSTLDHLYLDELVVAIRAAEALLIETGELTPKGQGHGARC